MADLRNHIIQVRKRPFQETMKFVSVPKEEWTGRPAAREIVEVLENAGFKEIGSWHLQSNPALKSLGYLREHDHVTAGVTLIGEQPCLSMQTWFTDGSTFELTQTVKPKNPFPEWMQKVHRPDLPPGRFEEEFQRLCPPRERRKISEADYVNQVEDEFRRTQIWYLERGGLTRDELREMVTDLPADEEQAAEALRMLRHEQAEFTLFQWLKRQSLPLDCDEQIEFIHIVHQAMDANLLRTEWMCATNDYKVREPEFAGPDPLEIFAAMNEKKGNPLQRLSRKETGLRADFYVPRDLLE